MEVDGHNGRDIPCGGITVEVLGGGSSSKDIYVSGGGSGKTTNDPFADPLRDLFRCLCGVVVGRWKQASLAERARKKAWTLHAVEAVNALIRTLEVGRLIMTRIELRRERWALRAGFFVLWKLGRWFRFCRLFDVLFF